MKSDPRTTQLLVLIDGAFSGPGWQGPTLAGTLRGLRVSTLLYRPAPQRKCIWEHALHAAYWKYIVARQLDPDGELTFPRSPSNWPKLPHSPSTSTWRADLAILRDAHESLRDAVARFSAASLDHRLGRRKWTAFQTIAGAAAHDAYHTGQIKLLNRLATTG